MKEDHGGCGGHAELRPQTGHREDQVVQELGWDEDTDDDIRADIEDACGGELLDEDADDVVDVVLLWWRDEDGDLVDRLMDAITPLAEDGVIWVVTPKTGQARPRPARRDRRIRADGRADADLVCQPRRLDREQAGAAEVEARAREALVLAVGAQAPDFTLKDQNGRPVTLSAFRGAKDVLLVFFPLAFTGICQGELDEIRDHLAGYENDDTPTLAISVGPPPTHKVWATQSGFTFPVLSDFWPHGAVAQAYGVFNDDAGFANRGTFVDRPLGRHPVRRDEAAGGASRSGRVERPRWPRCVADGFPVPPASPCSLPGDGRVAQW